MTEASRIAEQLRRALRGPAWQGDSLAEILEDVTAEPAAQRPIPDAHAIHALALHAATWAAGASLVTGPRTNLDYFVPPISWRPTSTVCPIPSST